MALLSCRWCASIVAAELQLGSDSGEYFSSLLSHLHNANGNADQFMALSLQAPFSPLGITKANLTKTATAYAEALDRHAVAYAKRTDDLVENSAQKLKQIDDRLANSNEELTKLEGRVAGVETTVQSQLSTFNSTFQASESTRATNFDTWFPTLTGAPVPASALGQGRCWPAPRP